VLEHVAEQDGVEPTGFERQLVAGQVDRVHRVEHIAGRFGSTRVALDAGDIAAGEVLL
jgi:hypothetical protein